MTDPRARVNEVREAALEHLDGMHHLARYLTRSADLAEDLVQEAVARALAGAGGYQPGTNPRAWLFRILRNVFIDIRRRDRRGAFGAELDSEQAEAESDDPVRGDPELDRIRSLVASDIEAAVLSLSADARLVVLLDREGLSEREVADVLGCPAGTVKSRLARARATLRDRLRDYAK